MSAGVSWHRGKEVTAEDLARTEAWLVGRFGLGPSMLDRFRLDGSVLFQAQESGRLLVGATDFAGITDRGHPVDVGPEEFLELSLPAEYRGQEFELSVLCNPDWGEPGSDDPMPKLLLTVDAEARRALGGRLGLGRWRVTEEAELEMVALPLPSRLGALLPHDAWWEQWVSPFRKALEGHLAGGRLAASADWRQLLWLNEISDLAASWVHMPVPVLAGRCRFAAWLAEGADLRTPAPDGGEVPRTTGQDLPSALVALLGNPIKTVAPPAPKPRTADPQPTTLGVALRFMSPDTLLARFPAEAATEMALCVALRCKPPARLQVRAGASASGFRVAAEMNGEPRATVMVYRLPSPPMPGETWRFSPLDGTAAESAYLSG